MAKHILLQKWFGQCFSSNIRILTCVVDQKSSKILKEKREVSIVVEFKATHMTPDFGGGLDWLSMPF